MARRRRRSLDLRLDPETRRGIAVVFLFAAAILVLLSIFDLAGGFGRSVDDGISHVFGWDKIVVPFFLLAWGYYKLSPEHLPLRFSNVLGILLFFLTLNPLVHAASFASHVGTVDDAALAVAGGKLGEAIAVPFIQMMGLAGTMTLFAALFVISLLLIFNATLQQVMFGFRWLAKAVVWLLTMLAHPAKVWIAGRERREEEARECAFRATAVEPQARLVEKEEPEEEENEETEESVEPEDETAEEADEEEVEAKAPPAKPKKRHPRIEVPLELLDRRDQKPTSGDIAHNR